MGSAGDASVARRVRSKPGDGHALHRGCRRGSAGDSGWARSPLNCWRGRCASLRIQAEALAHGDFSPRELVHTGSSEIADLSEALGETARHLGEQVRDLEQAREAGAAQAGQLRDLNRRTVRLQEDERRRIAGRSTMPSLPDYRSPYQARALRLGTSDDPDRSSARRDSTLDGIGELLSKAMEEPVLHRAPPARPRRYWRRGGHRALHRPSAASAQRPSRGGGGATATDARGPAGDLPHRPALHNALRHAAADEAVVRFEVIDDLLRVTIRDNGAGFNPKQYGAADGVGIAQHARTRCGDRSNVRRDVPALVTGRPS